MQRDNPLVLLLPRPKKGYGDRTRLNYSHGLIFLACVSIWATWYYWSYLVDQFHLLTKEVPFYVSRNCGFEWDGMRHADCGYLYIKEDRSKDDSPYIKLQFAIFRSDASTVHSDPIVYVSGGPGFAPLMDGETTEWLWKEDLPALSWATDRDLILFDPRGVGGSEPDTSCFEYELSTTIGSSYKNQQYEAAECLEETVKKSTNPSLYTSVTAAADLADLRKALALDSWNLWGESYGSRVALTAMATHQHGIRSAVLSGVYPPHIPPPADFAKFPVLIDQLMEQCQADAACQAAYPEVRQRFFDLLNRLRDDPLVLTVPLTRYSRTERVWFSDLRLLNLLYFQFYTRSGLEEIPKLIYDISKGEVARTVELLDWMDYGYYGPETSDGMMWSTLCNEEPEPDPLAIENAKDRYPHMSGWIDLWLSDSPCDSMAWQKVATARMDPVDSEIPTLLLSGYWDPATPTEWAQSAAEFLPNGFLFIFSNAAHDATSDDCASNIVTRFLANPMQKPDHPCFDNQPPLRFLE